MGVAPPVSQVRLEQEVKPVGFHKDLVQMAPEITSCAPAEEGGTEKPIEGRKFCSRGGIWRVGHRVGSRGSALLL